MNTTLHTLSALVAGAFLNLGLGRLAEFFDPLARESCADGAELMASAMPCIAPGCDVPAEYSLAR